MGEKTIVRIEIKSKAQYGEIGRWLYEATFFNGEKSFMDLNEPAHELMQEKLRELFK